MPKKAQPTKTLNPLHFEDLEPHRFEDLVRRLLYGFRVWREIEPTGRGGSDEGFDIRAWERTESVTNVSDEGEEARIYPTLWQVQGKREKSINPAKMRTIIKEGVSDDHPPYGYILAAATNITKKSYDVFRAELRKKGVREFHFWGKVGRLCLRFGTSTVCPLYGRCRLRSVNTAAFERSRQRRRTLRVDALKDLPLLTQRRYHACCHD